MTKKYYVVWKGRKTGVFDNWAECDAATKGYPGASFKAYGTMAEARNAWVAGEGGKLGEQLALIPESNEARPAKRRFGPGGPILPSYCVDAACEGNPGPLEFRCVKTESGEEVFREGPFPSGTNNIGEFLAIVHALRYLLKLKSEAPVYSDSLTALSWVQKKKAKTQLGETKENRRLFELIGEAEAWLAKNRYRNRVLKWETERWGENPADYGRK